MLMLGSGMLPQLAVAVLSLGSFVAFVSGTSWMVLLPAVLPAVIYPLLLASLTRYRQEPGSITFATLICGAVLAGTLATTVNEMAQLQIARLLGEAHARALTPAIAGPILEELCKALALLVVLFVRRESARPMLDAIAYGGLVGLGFAVVENINYFTLAAVQGGPAGLARSVYLRALLGGLNHAIFTGMVGAGIGGLLQAHGSGRGLAALIAGFCAAVAQHVVWNAWASRAITDVLCGAADPSEACLATPAHIDLFGTVPVIALVSVGPGLIAVGLLARSAAHRAGPPPMKGGGSALGC